MICSFCKKILCLFLALFQVRDNRGEHFYCMDHLELESHTWPRLLQLKPTLHFSGAIFVSSPSTIFLAVFFMYVCMHRNKGGLFDGLCLNNVNVYLEHARIWVNFYRNFEFPKTFLAQSIPSIVWADHLTDIWHHACCQIQFPFFFIYFHLKLNIGF